MLLIKPMLAEKAPVPFDSKNHVYEIKYDGARCTAYVEDGKVTLLARSGNDHTPGFPELQFHRQVHANEAVLDGEVIVEDGKGGHDFRALQSRIHTTDELKVRVRSQASPATFMAFDVLRVNGTDLTSLGRKIPLIQRKELLSKLIDSDARLKMVDHVEERGIELFDACILRGMEGAMAKDRLGLYHPGKRHSAWQKMKVPKEDSFIVCGYTVGEGWREGLFGSLLLGKPNGSGGLRYCGSVGSGFTMIGLTDVVEAIRDLHSAKCPFTEYVPEPKLDSWLEPRLVVDVKFAEETPDRKLRFPVYDGIRDDLKPEDVRPLVWS